MFIHSERWKVSVHYKYFTTEEWEVSTKISHSTFITLL